MYDIILMYFLVLAVNISACKPIEENSNKINLTLERENKELVQEINASILEELNFYRELIGVQTPSYVARLDLDKLKLSYEESIKIINSSTNTKSISVLIENLSNNHTNLLDSLIKPLADERYTIRELREKIDKYRIESEEIIDKVTDINSLFFRNELIYNHCLRICLRYLQEAELEDSVKIPIVKKVKKNGNEDYLEIYIGLGLASLTEEVFVKVNGSIIEIIEGKSEIKYSDLEKDTTVILVQSHSKIDGVITEAEYDYVKEE